MSGPVDQQPGTPVHPDMAPSWTYWGSDGWGIVWREGSRYADVMWTAMDESGTVTLTPIGQAEVNYPTTLSDSNGMRLIPVELHCLLTEWKGRNEVPLSGDGENRP